MNDENLGNLPCPLCKAGALETVVTIPWIRGFLIAYQFGSRKALGCVSCVRGELFKEVFKSMFLGWFSLSSLIINPFLILWNLLRTPFVSANPQKVLKVLKEIGYDPATAGMNILQLSYSLAAAMVMADGEIDEREVAVSCEIGAKLFEGFDPQTFVEYVQTTKERPPSHEIAALLEDSLEKEGKHALFTYLFAIAQADGVVGDEEQQELSVIAGAMGVDLEEWQAGLEQA